MEFNQKNLRHLRQTRLYDELWRLSFIKCYRPVDIEKLVQICLEDFDKNDLE